MREREGEKWIKKEEIETVKERSGERNRRSKRERGRESV